MDADVLIIGGGIAGLSAAYFASRADRDVVVIDAGIQRASDLPVALINPLRGHDGRLVRDGIAGMRATFALVDALRSEGHAIAHGRGLHRPLIDLDDRLLDDGYWRARLASSLVFEWHAAAPSSLGLVERRPSLFLPEPGWIAAPALLQALRDATGATNVSERVVAVAPTDGGGLVALSDGTTIAARSILWCGGAWGAACLDGAIVGEPSAGALFKPGSLLAVNDAATTVPLAFGLYAVPIGSGTMIVGPTREGSMSAFPASDPPAEVVTLLQDRVARTFRSTLARPVAAKPIWRGVRLARLSSGARRALEGVVTLTALDSRGFLMAPLLAARWARSL